MIAMPLVVFHHWGYDGHNWCSRNGEYVCSVPYVFRWLNEAMSRASSITAVVRQLFPGNHCLHMNHRHRKWKTEDIGGHCGPKGRFDTTSPRLEDGGTYRRTWKRRICLMSPSECGQAGLARLLHLTRFRCGTSTRAHSTRLGGNNGFSPEPTAYYWTSKFRPLNTIGTSCITA